MECSSALTTWLSDVESQCAGDQIITDGRFIEPYTIPLKYIAGYDMACLQDRCESSCVKLGSLGLTLNSFNNWCFLESQGWESVGNAR